MLKKSTLWLCLLLISVLATPAWSLPKSMIMTMSINSKQGARPVAANAKLWYANNQFRAEITSNMSMAQSGPVKINSKATIVMNLSSKVGYLLDSSSRTAIRVDQSQMPATGGGTALTNPASMTDPAKVKAEIQRQGGKVVGKANLLGHSCTVWQMTSVQKIPAGQGRFENLSVTSKLWLADDLGMPLKVDVNSARGNLISMNVTSVQVNVPINGGIFGVQAGYSIRNLSDMYKTPH